MKKKKASFWDRFQNGTQDVFTRNLKYIFFGSLVGLAVTALVFTALNLYTDYSIMLTQDFEINLEFAKDIIKANVWARVFIVLFALFGVIALGCTLYIIGFGLSSALSNKSTSMPVRKPTILSEEAIERIKPLIIPCFCKPTYWGQGTNYSNLFKVDVKNLLENNEGVMKIGRLAYILYQNGWVADKDLSFNAWIKAFFSCLGLDAPGETSPNKYSENNLTMAATFSEVDKTFHYLFTR